MADGDQGFINSYWLIPLGKSEALARVDVADFDSLNQHVWYRETNGYACRKPGKRKIYMHREVLGLELTDGIFADHIDGNRCDNRRANLRTATAAQNQHNRRRDPRNASGYRGVTWSKAAQKWAAQGHTAGRHHHLGLFTDIDDAARAAANFRARYMPYAP